MYEKLRNWLSTHRTPLPSFRFMFTMMYMGVIGSIAYFNVLMNCGRRFLGGGAAMLAIVFLLLIGLGQFEQTRYRHEASGGIAVTFLLARMVLFEGVGALDCSMLSILLYPLIPFSVYFSFGAGASGAFSAFYGVVSLWRAWQADPNWYTNPIITVILVAFVFIMVFMQGMARAIHRDEQSQRRTEQLLADLEDSHARLQVYAKQVAELATTEERNRLARDIHDSVGHYLTAVNIQLEKALVYRDHSPGEATQAIRDAKQAAGAALREVRRSVGALRSGDSGFSLRRALGELIQGVKGDELSIELSVKGDERDYNRLTLMVLYRAAQEGLTNIQRHAKARHIILDVELGDQTARLRLQDDGQGFASGALEDLASPTYSGFGLQGLRERLDLVQGQMRVTSTPAQGAELLITVPRQPVDLTAETGLPLKSRPQGQRQ